MKENLFFKYSYSHVNIPSNIFCVPSNVFEKSKFPDQDKEKVSSKLFEFSFLPVENARWNDECKTFGSRFEHAADIIHITSMVIITEYLILTILNIVNIQYVN